MTDSELCLLGTRGKPICPECHGNGYVPDADYESRQPVYRDCEKCDSQGELSLADKDTND